MAGLHERLTVGRRQLLGAVAAGGVAVVGGCIGGEEDGRDGAGGDVWRTTVHGDVKDLKLGAPRGPLGSFVFDVGFVIDRETGDPEFVLAEGYEEEVDRVSITLEEGSEWSSGEAITGADVGRWLTMYRAGSPWMTPVPAVRSGEATPRTVWEAITDVEWTDRTVTVEGAFEAVESPLSVLNTYLAGRPRRYHEGYWAEFRRSYDESPWESEATRTDIEDALDGIWDPSRGRPGATFESVVRLEGEVGEEPEAAFSGLWYPYRRDAGDLRFAVNESHPFADRVNYEEVVWTFTDDPNGPIRAIQSGDVVGSMRTDLTAAVLEDLPPGMESVPGPAETLTTLTLHYGRSRLDDRDVRAALQYAIDRNRLIESVNPATTTAVSVPGADLQPERWLAPSFRDRLRDYDHDRERAGALLENAGFVREGGSWSTPEGEPFALDLLATIGDSALERSVAAQLRSFGIDADYVAVEETTYRERLDYGYFDATRRNHPNPGAADVGRTRTADLVRRPPYRTGAPHSVYLGEELDRDGERSAGWAWERTTEGESTPNGRLVYDDPEALRSVTVRAPPEGEPEGEPIDWPYIYHAAMATAAREPERRREHARICTWIYNYQVPELELAIERPRIVHRTNDWSVPPTDDPVWKRSGRGLHAGGLWAALGHGRIRRAEDDG